jgi:hypothetical protein
MDELLVQISAPHRGHGRGRICCIVEDLSLEEDEDMLSRSNVRTKWNKSSMEKRCRIRLVGEG